MKKSTETSVANTAISMPSITKILPRRELSGDDKPQDAYGASKAAMIRLSKSCLSNVIFPPNYFEFNKNSDTSLLEVNLDRVNVSVALLISSLLINIQSSLDI